MARSPYRKGIRIKQEFWLFKNKLEDRRLIAYCDDLRAARNFLPTLRDALMLIMDLRNGRTDVLVSLFPDVPMAFQQTNLQSEFDRLAELIAARPIAAASTSIGGVSTGQPMKISLDDFGLDLNITAEAQTGKSNAVQNLLDQMLEF